MTMVEAGDEVNIEAEVEVEEISGKITEEEDRITLQVTNNQIINKRLILSLLMRWCNNKNHTYHLTLEEDTIEDGDKTEIQHIS